MGKKLIESAIEMCSTTEWSSLIYSNEKNSNGP